MQKILRFAPIHNLVFNQPFDLRWAFFSIILSMGKISYKSLPPVSGFMGSANNSDIGHFKSSLPPLINTEWPLIPPYDIDKVDEIISKTFFYNLNVKITLKFSNEFLHFDECDKT